jgi:aspartyl aminopeptidase
MTTQAQHRHNEQLIHFLNQATDPYHATAYLASLLRNEGFQELNENESWQLKSTGRYFVTRQDSSLIAWCSGKKKAPQTGLRLLGAHTDSPCLKLRHDPEILRSGCVQTGIEVYGGVLLSTWLDRELNLSGRLVYKDAKNQVHSTLWKSSSPVALIPNLAIHLNRGVNDSWSFNAERDMVPVMALANHSRFSDYMRLELKELLKSKPDKSSKNQSKKSSSPEILDYDLVYSDARPAGIVGMQNDFVMGGRLDNLLSCYLAIMALINAEPAGTAMVILTDHEEVGSTSYSGADGTFLEHILQRLIPDTEERLTALSRSFFLSSDNAHGQHPNYPDKHHVKNPPRLHGGPVLKINANQRYATNAWSASLVRHWAKSAKIPLQTFSSRCDMPCGTTIGPLVASRLGILTADVGVPTWAMHSSRETAGTQDSWSMLQLMKHYFHLADLAQ